MRTVLRKRYGHGGRRYARHPDNTGRKRLLKGWVIYRGYTLDPWKGKKVQHSRATWEVRIFRATGPAAVVPTRLSEPSVVHNMQGNTFGETLEEAMTKAKRLVDAMEGD
jgi:hypothetical protein